MPISLNRWTARRGPLLTASAFATTAALALATAPQASASKAQLSILQDTSFASAPATALPLARSLGARVVRVPINWSLIAPHPEAKQKPSSNLANPNAYPADRWAPYDSLVRTAKAEGVTVALQITGGPPRWAIGAGAPGKYLSNLTLFGWRPSATLYGQFVHAVTERYSGHFRPTGTSTALPAVRFWSFWNEPNFGTYLGPQTTSKSTVPLAPGLYRSLLNAAWKAAHQTGHGHDTLLAGELDPLGNSLARPGRGSSVPGVNGTTSPLSFVRALYCVDSDYKKLTGTVARQWGCPTSAAASRKFRSANPALFSSSGFAIHPYTLKQSPTSTKVNNNYATFPVLSRLTTALDKSISANGGHKRFSIYNDEFGFITRPPSGAGFPSPAKAAVYLNQSEYLSYKNPRIATYDQYLIKDAQPIPGRPAPGFNTGLYTWDGKPKATVNAYRLPLWLPKQTVQKGTKVEVWGGARPATYVAATSQRVSIQMQKGGHGAWKTIQTVKTAARNGYFDVHPKLPYSGNIRLSYRYPQTQSFLPPKVAGSTINSRTIKVKVTG